MIDKAVFCVTDRIGSFFQAVTDKAGDWWCQGGAIRLEV